MPPPTAETAVTMFEVPAIHQKTSVTLKTPKFPFKDMTRGVVCSEGTAWPPLWDKDNQDEAPYMEVLRHEVLPE